MPPKPIGSRCWPLWNRTLAERQQEYRNVTARMIAQFAVHEVLDDVADEEARMIEKGLQAAAIRESIRLMCPRYHALRSG